MKPWLKWLILGIISVLFGIFALGNAVAASLAVTTVTGVIFVVIGIIQIVAAFSETRTASKVLSILLGVLVALIGLSFLINPIEGTVSLALLVTVLVAASGIIRLVFAWRMRETRFFWPMLVTGALSILLAVYILANFSVASITLLGILLGIELLFNGAGLIAFALSLRAHLRGDR